MAPEISRVEFKAGLGKTERVGDEVENYKEEPIYRT
jgi:hypothetical protein